MMIKRNLLKDVKMKLAKLLHLMLAKKNLIMELLNSINGRNKI